MFEVTESQKRRIKEWLETTVYPTVIEQQRNDPSYAMNPFAASDWEAGYPYAGVSGGSLTYEFTPTSIGEILYVSYYRFPDKLDVTDYETW
jgi:hypothetical protein